MFSFFRSFVHSEITINAMKRKYKSCRKKGKDLKPHSSRDHGMWSLAALRVVTGIATRPALFRRYASICTSVSRRSYEGRDEAWLGRAWVGVRRVVGNWRTAVTRPTFTEILTANKILLPDIKIVVCFYFCTRTSTVKAKKRVWSLHHGEDNESIKPCRAERERKLLFRN